MEELKLADQLCFPLYALSRQFTSLYRPLLAKIGLTYPQYLVMLVLWEQEPLSVKKLGEALRLDSGTLTPLLKRLEEKKFLLRTRSSTDERMLLITLTPGGRKLSQRAAFIPRELMCALEITEQEANSLRNELRRLLFITDKK